MQPALTAAGSINCYCIFPILKSKFILYFYTVDWGCIDFRLPDDFFNRQSNLTPVDIAFDNLCERLAVWKCNQIMPRVPAGLATGFPALDAALPEHGWPSSALLELLSDTTGIGELSLLLPALSQISITRGIVLIAPPFVPYAPAFADAGIDLSRLLVIHQCPPRDALASAELALRSGACGAVVLWESCLFERPAQSIDYLALKRLHLAANHGNAMAVLFRPARKTRQPSPAVLRIKLDIQNGQLGLTLFKFRGLISEQTILLNPRAPRLQEELAVMPTIWSLSLRQNLPRSSSVPMHSNREE